MLMLFIVVSEDGGCGETFVVAEKLFYNVAPSPEQTRFDTMMCQPAQRFSCYVFFLHG